jgi:hypothetical protein
MLVYDLISSVLGIRNLASGIIVTAERPLSQAHRHDLLTEKSLLQPALDQQGSPAM